MKVTISYPDCLGISPTEREIKATQSLEEYPKEEFSNENLQMKEIPMENSSLEWMNFWREQIKYSKGGDF